MARAGRTGWKVEERPKKTDPAVDNPAVAVPKLKSKGNKRVEVGGGDKRLGRARIGEETVPVLHGHVERLDVGEFRGETEMKAGESEQKVGRARGRRTSAQPKGRIESAWRTEWCAGGRKSRQRQGGEVAIAVTAAGAVVVVVQVIGE